MNNEALAFAQRVRISVRCSQCENEEEQLIDVTVRQGMSIPPVTLPAGWAQYGDYLFCPKHEVQMNIVCDRRVLEVQTFREPEERRPKAKGK